MIPIHKYNYLLFDLDHTLWDFEKNSTEALTQLYYEFELDIHLKSGLGSFLSVYIDYNFKLWKEYEIGNIEKEELRWLRFHNTLIDFGYKNESLSKILADKYLEISPYKTHLIPFTFEILEKLHKTHKMVIITNGFEEVQSIKMKESGLDKYFDIVITSEMAGHKKPASPIFKMALDSIKGIRKEALMIGDNFHSDIIGAKKFGIDQAYLNPQKSVHKSKPTYDIDCLSKLIEKF